MPTSSPTSLQHQTHYGEQLLLGGLWHCTSQSPHPVLFYFLCWLSPVTTHGHFPHHSLIGLSFTIVCVTPALHSKASSSGTFIALLFNMHLLLIGDIFSSNLDLSRLEMDHIFHSFPAQPDHGCHSARSGEWRQRPLWFLPCLYPWADIAGSLPRSPGALLPAAAEAAANSSHLQLPQSTALGACSCLAHWFQSKEGAKQVNGLRSKGQKHSQISAPVCLHGTEWLQKKNRVEMGTWPGYLTSTASVEKSRTNQSWTDITSADWCGEEL